MLMSSANRLYSIPPPTKKEREISFVFLQETPSQANDSQRDLSRYIDMYYILAASRFSYTLLTAAASQLHFSSPVQLYKQNCWTTLPRTYINQQPLVKQSFSESASKTSRAQLHFIYFFVLLLLLRILFHFFFFLHLLLSISFYNNNKYLKYKFNPK